MKINAVNETKRTHADEVEKAHEEMRKNNIAYKLHYNPLESDVIWSPVIIDDVFTGYRISTYGDLIDSNDMPCKQWDLNGYVQYVIYVDGKRYSFLAHRMVAEAFLTNDDPEHKTEVDHLFGNKKDNYYKVLDWVTSNENKRRAVNLGLYKRKYSKELIERICYHLERGVNPVDIAKECDVPVSVVYSVQYGSWTVIPARFNIRNEDGKPFYNTREITKEQAVKVCEMLQAGSTPTEVAEKLCISINIVHGIKYGTTYQEISKDYTFDTKYRSVSDEDAHRVCKMYQSGMSPLKIHYEMPHIKLDTIYTIVNNTDSYQDIRNQYDFTMLDRTRVRGIPDETVHKICQMIERGSTLMDVANALNIDVRQVSNIRHGLSYRDISSRYHFPDNIKKSTRQYSDELVHTVCKRMQDGESPTALAKEFNMKVDDVRNIRKKSAYRDIARQYTFPANLVLKNRRLSDETVHKICQMMQDGKMPLEISRIVNVPQKDIYDIRSGNAYRDISRTYNMKPKLAS